MHRAVDHKRLAEKEAKREKKLKKELGEGHGMSIACPSVGASRTSTSAILRYPEDMSHRKSKRQRGRRARRNQSRSASTRSMRLGLAVP